MASFVMDNQLKSAYCLFNQIATNDDNVPMDLSRNSSLTSSSLNHYDELNTTENIYYDKCIDSQKSDEYKCIVNESIIMNKYSENNRSNEKLIQFMNTTDNPIISSQKQSLSFCQNSQLINKELCQTYKNYHEEHRNTLPLSKISNNYGINSTNDHKCRFMIQDILKSRDHPSSAINEDDNMNSTSAIQLEKSVYDSKSFKECSHSNIIFFNKNNNKSVNKIRNKPTSFRFKTSTTESFESSISLTSKNMRSIPHVAINVNNNNNNSIVNQIEKNESYLGEEQENRKEDSENAQNTLNYYSRQHRIDYNRFVEDEEQQNCSTCNLSFCQPIDFVIHIQKVHLGLKMANNENNLIKPLKESVQSNKNHIRKSNKIHRNVDDTNGINRVTYRDNNNHTKDQIRNNEDGIDHPLSLKSTRKRSYQSVKTVGYD
uniref:C2H2-type domain-containing protein n=1 Tax=Schistosoma mansoni TaxID=6183 RepID=A0A5K4FEQ4_SCHMA